MRRTLLIALLVWLGGAGTARAEEDPAVARRAAEHHFATGEAHFKARRLSDAHKAFMEAADQAASVGWAEKEAAALYHAGVSASQGAMWAQAMGAFERQGKVEKARGNKLGYANATLNVGIIHWRFGQNDAAMARYDESIAIHRAEENKKGIAKVLGLMGSVWRSRGDLPRALTHQQQSLAISKELADREAVALTRGNIANIYTDMGRGADAITEQEAVLAIQRELGDDMRAANTMYNIAVLLHDVGRPFDAYTRHLETLAFREKIGDRQGAAVSLLGVGRSALGIQRYAEARRRMHEGLRRARALGDLSWVARGLAFLASLERETGNAAAAIRHLEEALELHRRQGRAIGVAETLGQLGGAYFFHGRMAKALELQLEAVTLARALRSKPVLAARLTDLGGLYVRLSQYEAAEKTLQEARALFREMKQPLRLAEATNNLGGLLREAGRAAEAIPLVEESLAIGLKYANPRVITFARSVLGTIYSDLGRTTEAIALHETALKSYRESGDPHGIVHSLTSLASTYLKMGEADKARALREEALTLADELGNDLLLLINLWGIATVHVRTQDHVAALEAVERGAAVVERIARGLSDEEMASAREHYARLFDVGIVSAMRAKDAGALLRVLERGRAIALLDGLGRPQAVGEIVLPAELHAAEQGAREQEVRAIAALRAATRAGKRRDIRAARKALEGARTARVEVSKRIQRESRIAAELVRFEPASLADVQGRLAADQAQVTYAVTDQGAVALVVRKSGARMVRLGPGSPIRVACRELELHTVESKDTAKRIASLRALVATPLTLGDDVRQVIVSPHDALCSAPLSVLWPERAVVCVPSATVWARGAEQARARGTGVLAVGDPDYRAFRSTRKSAAAIHRGNLTQLVQLPGTRAEVTAVGTTRLLGAEATEAGFIRALTGAKRWRSVHMACHGLFDMEDPQLSSLALTPDPEDPANDGFLTALDVLRLRVPADLVVLSACETGQGAIYRAEGIVGLQRAFMFAGAGQVVCSLWKVDDDATRALMIKLYELWNAPAEPGKAPLSAAQALQQAQAHIRAQDKWSHPYYWSAWTLWSAGQ